MHEAAYDDWPRNLVCSLTPPRQRRTRAAFRLSYGTLFMIIPVVVLAVLGAYAIAQGASHSEPPAPRDASRTMMSDVLATPFWVDASAAFVE